jgi:hypothetical protein
MIDGYQIVAAHAHTKKKKNLQPLLAITLARYVDVSDIGDFYNEWLQASKVFAFDGAARGGSSKVTERQWRTLDDWISFDQAVMELRLGKCNQTEGLRAPGRPGSQPLR